MDQIKQNKMKDRKIILELTPEEVRLLAYGAMPNDLKIRLREIAHHIDGQIKVEKALEEVEPKVSSSNNYIDIVRKKYPRAYHKWAKEESVRLKKLFSEGSSIQEISNLLQRQSGGVRSKLIKMELLEEIKNDSNR